MAMHHLGQQTLELVEAWHPRELHDTEWEFRDDLKEYIQDHFNRQGGTVAVSSERGRSRGDIVIDDCVGIELKNRFSNNQERRLRDQLYDYQDEYEFVISVACGIEDHDGWNRVKQEFSGQHDPMAPPVYFVHKQLSEMGGRPRNRGNSGSKSRSGSPDRTIAASGMTQTGGLDMDFEADAEALAQTIEHGMLGVRELFTAADTDLTTGEAVVGVIQLLLVAVIFGFVLFLVTDVLLL